MEDNKISKIVDFAKDFYRTLDDAHGVNHGLRVAKLALLINEKEKGDSFLVEAGAWLHQFHDNLDELKTGLQKLELSKEEYEGLYHIVEVCRPKKIVNARTKEAKIVYDADALEVIGPHGNIREIYCNLHFRGLDLSESISKTIDVDNLFKQTIQTNTGKKLCTYLSESTKEFWKIYDLIEALDGSILNKID